MLDIDLKLLHTDGLEAIRFNFNTSLVRRLDNLFSNGLEMSSKIDITKLSTDKAIKTAVTKLANYTQNGLEKIFKEECGIVITKYYRSESSFGNNLSNPASCAFGVFLDFINPDVVEKQLARYTYKKTKDDDVKRYMDLESIWDVDSSKLNSNLTDNGKKTGYVNVRFVFDTLGAYFLDRFNIVDSNRSGLSAEELTAIVLHEIGHVNSLIERASKTLYLAKQFNEDKTLLSKKMTFNEIDSAVDDIKNTVEPLKSKSIDSILANTKNAIDKLKTISEDNKTGFGKLFNMFFTRLLDLAKFILYLTVLICYRFYITSSIIDLALYNFANIRRSLGNKPGNKSGDVISTFSNDSQMERWADEFVSRHGRGAELSTALSKIIIYSKSSPMISYNSFHSSKLAHLMAMTLYGVLTAVMYHYPPIPYDEDTVRLRKIKEDCIAVFKDKNLPGFIRDNMLIQIEQADRAFKEMVAKKNNPLIKAVVFISSITSLNITALYRFISSNEDYEKLFDAMNSLDNNALYYLSSLLEKVSKE